MSTVSFKDFSGGQPVSVVGNETSPDYKKTIVPPRPTSLNTNLPVSEEVKPLTQIIPNAIGGVKNAISKGTEDLTSAATGGVKNMISKGFDVAGDVAGGVLAPLGAVIGGGVQTAGNLLGDLPGMQTLATSKYSVVSKILDFLDKGGAEADKLKKEHPEITKKAEGLSNLVQMAILANTPQGKGNPDVSDIYNKAKDTFTGQNSAVNGIIDQHLTSTNQILDNVPPEDLKAMGGQPEVMNRLKTNIVDGLRAEGENGAAARVSGIDASGFKTAEEFAKAAKEAASASTVVKQVPIENIKDAQGMSLEDIRNQAKTTSEGLTAMNNQPSAADAFHGARLGRQVTEPLEATANPDGSYSIVDGTHRLRQAIMNGDATVPINVPGEPQGVLGKLSEGVGALEQKVKTAVKGSPEEIAQKSFQKTVEAVKPLKGEGLTRNGMLGKSANETSPLDIQRAEAVHPYIEGVSDPVKQYQNIDNAITDITQKDIIPHLNRNPVNMNFEDLRNYLETNKPTKPNFANDPVASENYNRITENGITTLEQVMRDSAKKTGNYGSEVSVNDIETTRKIIDAQINNELGENTFGTPQYKGIKAAAVDMRNLFNRMSEDLLRYPGQTEALNKYNELLRELKAKNIEVAPEQLKQLQKQQGLKSTPESEANARYLSEQHAKQTQMFDALDNIYERYSKKVGIGKNYIQEFFKTPVGKVIKNAGKAAGRAFGIGEAVSLIK